MSQFGVNNVSVREINVGLGGDVRRCDERYGWGQGYMVRVRVRARRNNQAVV